MVRKALTKWKEIDGEPVRARSLLDWAYWFQHAERNLARTVVEDAMVSTVFLGIDHSWGMGPFSILYESMIFAEHDEEIDNDMRRYSTRAEALVGHREMVKMLEQRYGAVAIEKIQGEEDEQAQARNRGRRQARRKARSRAKNRARLRSEGRKGRRNHRAGRPGAAGPDPVDGRAGG
jgi:hypothetical protein